MILEMLRWSVGKKSLRTIVWDLTYSFDRYLNESKNKIIKRYYEDNFKWGIKNIMTSLELSDFRLF